MAEWSISCNSAEHATVQWWGGALLVLWAGLIPCAYTALLVIARREIRRGLLDGLAGETSFLWDTYTQQFYFWEVCVGWGQCGGCVRG